MILRKEKMHILRGFGRIEILLNKNKSMIILHFTYMSEHNKSKVYERIVLTGHAAL